ncbi:hypothetical protein [Ralstonia pseudosolanacearum]|uniref:hypothetical protein n=1 Tax=Ralstonia pseudosolanacearum TaxID=1310165 RepID=UPI003CEEFA4F
MTLKALILAAPMALLPLVASANDVPKVDIHGTIVVTKPASQRGGFDFPAERTRMIKLPDGKQMPLGQFLETYCQGKYTDETCARGSRIYRIDSSTGPRDQLPAGL